MGTALLGGLSLPYDGARAVFLLPLLLVTALAGTFQDPVKFGVTHGSEEVSASSIDRVSRLVRRGLGRLGPTFPGVPVRPFEVIVHANDSSLADDIAAVRHPGSPGLALLQRQEVHLTLSAMQAVPPGDLGTVVDHELVHILLHQYAGPNGGAVPHWFHEGLAQELAGGSWHNFKEEDLVFRVATDSLLQFHNLEHDFPDDRIQLAYGQSYSFVAFLAREFGVGVLIEIVDRMSDGVDFNTALVRVLKSPRVSLEEKWRDYLLFQSGAGLRTLLRNCFSFLMILALPILALAVRRRLLREQRLSDKLAKDEVTEQSPFERDRP